MTTLKKNQRRALDVEHEGEVYIFKGSAEMTEDGKVISLRGNVYDKTENAQMRGAVEVFVNPFDGYLETANAMRAEVVDIVGKIITELNEEDDENA